MAQRALTFEDFTEPVPETPLQRTAHAALDPKLKLSVTEIFLKRAVSSPQGLKIEDSAVDIESFRFQAENALRFVSEDAALLALRKGDERILPEPVEPGEESIPFHFQRRYNTLLYQMLSMVCIMGHSLKILKAHAASTDGRAVLLTLIQYVEPHLGDELGCGYYMDVLSTTEIFGQQNPLDAFNEMDVAVAGYNRVLPDSPMPDVVFRGLIISMLRKNSEFKDVLNDIDHKRLVGFNSSQLKSLVISQWHKTYGRKPSSQRGVANAAAAGHDQQRMLPPPPRQGGLPVSAFPMKKYDDKGKFEHLCCFCEKDGQYHRLQDCPILAPLARRRPMPFNRQAGGGKGGGTAGVARSFWQGVADETEDGFQLAASSSSETFTGAYLWYVQLAGVLGLLVFGLCMLILLLSSAPGGFAATSGSALVTTGIVTFRVDSGCTDHLVCSASLVHVWDHELPPKHFDTAGGRVLSPGGGSSTFESQNEDGSSTSVTLYPVYYLPRLEV